MSPPARLLSALIVVYRRVVSPLIGPRCRFEPSCSSYALEALREHGAARGSVLAGWRLLRCQPWGTAGYDPVPERDDRRHRRDCGDPRPVAEHRRHRTTRGARPC